MPAHDDDGDIYDANDYCVDDYDGEDIFVENHNNLYIPVYNWQRAVRPVKTCVSLRVGRSKAEVPDMEMRIHYLFHLWNLLQILGRQNLRCSQYINFASLFRINTLFYL